MTINRISKRAFVKILASGTMAELKCMGKVSPTLIRKWDAIQDEMRKQIVSHDTQPWQLSSDLSGLKRIGGVDISVPTSDHDSEECDAFAAVVILQYPELTVIHEETQQVRLTVPYLPGYLSFREAGPVTDLIQSIITNHPDKVPDVLIVDGNGMLHPHRCGLACHIGIKTSIPTIGVAKNLHLLEDVNVTRQMLQGMAATGDHTLIKDASNNTLGMALKTADDAKNPIYLSIGHKISLDTAKRVVLKCSKYRVPEPIRFADNVSRELVRKLEKKSQSQEVKTLQNSNTNTNPS